MSLCAFQSWYKNLRAVANHLTAEFRGPGTHHRFDDSPTDDYDMDMDQRTRLIGGRQGRIILLGDGTEIHVGGPPDDDGDVDMEDRGEAEEADDSELDEKVQEDAASHDAETNGETDRSKREETPAPAQAGRDTELDHQKVDDAKKQQAESNNDGSEPSEPKMAAATDSLDTKTVAEHTEPKESK